MRNLAREIEKLICWICKWLRICEAEGERRAEEMMA